VESAGATEGAPAAGAAEAIVDITTTGATLAANGLKVIEDGTILESQAHLVASLTAEWSDTAREAARGILARIAAEEIARTHREVRVAASAAVDPAQAASRFGAVPLARDAGAMRLLCPVGQVYALADWLISRGAGDVSVGALDYVFSPDNPLWDRLAGRIAG
jgi:ATP phosphoribosyltransferase